MEVRIIRIQGDYRHVILRKPFTDPVEARKYYDQKVKDFKECGTYGSEHDVEIS